MNIITQANSNILLKKCEIKVSFYENSYSRSSRFTVYPLNEVKSIEFTYDTSPIKIFRFYKATRGEYKVIESEVSLLKFQLTLDPPAKVGEEISLGYYIYSLIKRNYDLFHIEYLANEINITISLPYKVKNAEVKNAFIYMNGEIRETPFPLPYKLDVYGNVIEFFTRRFFGTILIRWENEEK